MSVLRRPAPFLRFAITIAFAFLVAFSAPLTTPRPVYACSCIAFDSLKRLATPDTVIFTGTAGAQQARGVPVEVGRWYWGAGSAPVVWLASSSFGDSAACGAPVPPAGSSWLWVGNPTDNEDVVTSLCSLSGRLDTAEGKALLVHAEAVFAAGAAAPEPAVKPTPEVVLPTAPPGPADSPTDQTGVLILAVLLLGSLILFGGVILAARQSSRGSGRDGS